MTDLREEWYIKLNAFDEQRPVMRIGRSTIPKPRHDSETNELFDANTMIELFDSSDWVQQIHSCKTKYPFRICACVLRDFLVGENWS